VKSHRIAIVGTVGIPSGYGGFETLAQNLVDYHAEAGLTCDLTVYCAARAFVTKPKTYRSARLVYLSLNANGLQSVLYDAWSIGLSVWRHHNVILLLGVSGALVLPFVRLLSSVKIVTNVDGIEWRRAKWGRGARLFLRSLEWIAVRFSHLVIADNNAIAQYLADEYGTSGLVIAYGGDHAVAARAEAVDDLSLPDEYALAVCRIEPENNVHLIVEAFANQHDLPLVMIGNWNGSRYGRGIRSQYERCTNVRMLDPIYNLGRLRTLRSRASLYVHGHSAGGTNPSLVEAMHFSAPILAFDCAFNRATTEDKAAYFCSSEELAKLIRETRGETARRNADAMNEIACRRYRWSVVGAQYFEAVGTGASVKS
jgi:glycosyltransferase involved in cell wall biosynthesis